jgi:hypothetical protein
MVGLSLTSGKPLWKLPTKSASICSITSTQMLGADNGDLAVINLGTGSQVSYTTSSGTCPPSLPGGITVTSSSNGPSTLVQSLAP